MKPESRWRSGLTLFSSLAAAGLAAAILFRFGSSERLAPEQTIVPVQLAPLVEIEKSGRTRLAYWRALARSPEVLDALFDKDTMVSPRPAPEFVQFYAFARSDAALRALLGED